MRQTREMIANGIALAALVGVAGCIYGASRALKALDRATGRIVR